jgi:hypothetical protein
MDDHSRPECVFDTRKSINYANSDVIEASLCDAAGASSAAYGPTQTLTPGKVMSASVRRLNRGQADSTPDPFRTPWCLLT